MADYKRHLSFGLVLGIGVLVLLSLAWSWKASLEHMATLLGLCLIGSLLPDIDTDSRAQNLIYAFLILFDLFLIFKKEYEWAAIVGLCAMFPALGPHRGWTHSLWAMLLIPLPIIIVPVLLFSQPWQAVLPYYLAVLLGYFSHLLLDRRFF